MKKIISIQIVSNVILLAIFCLFLIGKMVDIKFTYDDSQSQCANEIGKNLYDNLLKSGIVCFITISVNIIFSYWILKKYRY